MLLSQGLALGLADLGGSPTHSVLAGRLGGFLPMQSLWLIVMALALWLLLNRHPLGDAIRFTGEQADIASRLGINVPAARLGVHTLMGGIAGFAGAIGCMEMGSWWPTQGDGYMLLVFAAVFIGGTSVFGGSGRLYGTLIGIAIVGMIEAGVFCVWYGGEKGRASSKPLSREKRQVASGAHCLIGTTQGNAFPDLGSGWWKEQQKGGFNLPFVIAGQLQVSSLDKQFIQFFHECGKQGFLPAHGADDFSSSGAAVKETRRVSPMPSLRRTPMPTEDLMAPRSTPPASVTPRCSG